MGILNNHLFQEYPIRIFSLPCQHRVQVKQHPSSWTTFGDCFFTTYQLLLVVLAKIFTSTLSITIFWIRCIHLLTQRCGGSLFSSTSYSLLHLILRVHWKQFLFKHLLLGLIVSCFGCIILLQGIPANFTTSSTFSPCTFFWIFTCHCKMKTNGAGFHIKSCFSFS